MSEKYNKHLSKIEKDKSTPDATEMMLLEEMLLDTLVDSASYAEYHAEAGDTWVRGTSYMIHLSDSRWTPFYSELGFNIDHWEENGQNCAKINIELVDFGAGQSSALGTKLQISMQRNGLVYQYGNYSLDVVALCSNGELQRLANDDWISHPQAEISHREVTEYDIGNIFDVIAVFTDTKTKKIGKTIIA